MKMYKLKIPDMVPRDLAGMVAELNYYVDEGEELSEQNVKEINNKYQINIPREWLKEFKMIGLENVIEQLKIDEGYRQFPYRCTAGKLTIAYGLNLDDRGIKPDEAEYLLKKVVIECYNELKGRFSWFTDLPDSKQEVLINMCFNVGISRLLGFKKMIVALEQKDYQEAARQMIDSTWYKQVGARARRLVRVMSNGYLA